MYHRSHETAAPTTSELAPAHRSEAPEPDVTHPSHSGPLSRAALLAGGAPGPQAQAAALNRASGGRLARTGPALLQLQRQYGNRYVQRVVNHAREGGHAPPVQKGNQTGLPDRLKAGVENLSGLSLDDVQVHYNSSKPARLQALTYTQGTGIHVGPGQEKHLAHEAWHVVQQKQGRVQPTIRETGVAINDDERLEREADLTGKRASSWHGSGQSGMVQKPHESGSPLNSGAEFAQNPSPALVSQTPESGREASGSTVLQMYEPKKGKETKRVAELRRTYVKLNDDDEEFYGPKFDAFVLDAESMDQIETMVSALEAAKAKKPVPTISAPKEPTKAKAVSPPVSSKTQTTSTPKGKKKKPKKKWTPISLGPTVQTPPSVLQTIEEEQVPEGEVSNTIIQTVIDRTIAVVVRSIEVDGEATGDTVYYKITLEGPLQAETGRLNQFRKIYTLYLHYHPRPNTSNWLHIKRTHGATAGNKVERDNWLFKGFESVLTLGRTQWESGSGLTATPGYAL